MVWLTEKLNTSPEPQTRGRIPVFVFRTASEINIFCRSVQNPDDIPMVFNRSISTAHLICMLIPTRVDWSFLFFSFLHLSAPGCPWVTHADSLPTRPRSSQLIQGQLPSRVDFSPLTAVTLSEQEPQFKDRRKDRSLCLAVEAMRARHVAPVSMLPGGPNLLSQEYTYTNQ